MDVYRHGKKWNVLVGVLYATVLGIPMFCAILIVGWAVGVWKRSRHFLTSE